MYIRENSNGIFWSKKYLYSSELVSTKKGSYLKAFFIKF